MDAPPNMIGAMSFGEVVLYALPVVLLVVFIVWTRRRTPSDRQRQALKLRADRPIRMRILLAAISGAVLAAVFSLSTFVGFGSDSYLHDLVAGATIGVAMQFVLAPSIIGNGAVPGEPDPGPRSPG